MGPTKNTKKPASGETHRPTPECNAAAPAAAHEAAHTEQVGGGLARADICRARKPFGKRAAGRRIRRRRSGGTCAPAAVPPLPLREANAERQRKKSGGRSPVKGGVASDMEATMAVRTPQGAAQSGLALRLWACGRLRAHSSSSVLVLPPAPSSRRAGSGPAASAPAAGSQHGRRSPCRCRRRPRLGGAAGAPQVGAAGAEARATEIRREMCRARRERSVSPRNAAGRTPGSVRVQARRGRGTIKSTRI